MSNPNNIFDLGFCIMPRAHFFAKCGPAMHCYEGDTSMRPDQIATAHMKERSALMERVTNLKGNFILWKPDDNAEGFVLVGDNAESIMNEAFDHEMSMRS